MTRRVLALWEPWAILTVAHDYTYTPSRPPKGVETRHFPPNVSLPCDVVIHATKKWGPDLTALAQSWPFRRCLERVGYYPGDPRRFLQRAGMRGPDGCKPIPLGALIGVATIVRVAPATSFVAEWSRFEDDVAEMHAEEKGLGNYDPGRFGWELANARELPTPIPFSGRQDVLYPLLPCYEEQVDEQLAAVAQ